MYKPDVMIHKRTPYIMLILVLLMATLQSHAQFRNGLEEKYQDYRERLRNEFMVGIGPDFGHSLPATVRDTVSGRLLWTDCTIELGQYIGMLGLEYQILEQQGEDTGETVEELFWAMYALNRLDYYAEDFFGGTPSLNGFFIRDDVAEDSLDMNAVLEHLNQGLPQPAVTFLASDLMSPNPRDKEESLDQAILLVTGLGIVTRTVPPGVRYYIGGEPQPFQDFTTSLQAEAQHQIVRIINYMKEGDSTTVELDPADPNLYGIQGMGWDFIIKNPVTYENVMRGDNAFFLSMGYAGSKYHLTGQDAPTTDTIRRDLALTLFLAMENFVLPNNQDFKVINLDAMSNIWPEGIQPDTTFTDYNARILGPRSQGQDFGWIPMLHQLVFDGNNYLMSFLPPDTVFYNDPEGYYEYLLELAPEEGPYNYNDSLYPNWEWSSTSRTIHPERRGETQTAFPGNYNGIDYMLYYNLYRVLFSDPVSTGDPERPSFRVWPNPAQDFVQATLPESKGPTQVEFINMQGQRVMQTHLAGGGTHKIVIPDLPKGMYILRILTENGHTINTQKIIKN